MIYPWEIFKIQIHLFFCIISLYQLLPFLCDREAGTYPISHMAGDGGVASHTKDWETRQFTKCLFRSLSEKHVFSFFLSIIYHPFQ